MKKFSLVKRTTAGLLAAAFMTLGATITRGAGPAIQGMIDIRPLTPQEMKDYSLTNAQGASGLWTIGLGQPAYLEADVNLALPDSNITNVTWTLSSKPGGSAAILANSPLGTNVPVYKPADRVVAKAVSRKMLVPDVTGQYTVTAIIMTSASGTTNLSRTINAGTYMGLNTCALCHSGGQVALNEVEPWSHTLHADSLTREIDGHGSPQFSVSDLVSHTLGYDLNPAAVNGGFDDIVTQPPWTFPATLTNGNWAAMPAALKNLGNIQCENCHGPGSEHAYSLGNTNRISVSYASGNCAQCHDNKNLNSKTAEWNNSKHAITTRTPSGPTRSQCVRCHTAMGFRNFIEFGGNTNGYLTNTVFEAITCAACHDPHDATNPHQLRAAPLYTLPDGTTVTNAGLGALCMQCHHSRNGEANANIANYKLGLPTWAGGSSFGVHDSTAGDMVEGVNAITYGKFIPSGSHSSVIPNVCVGCHMQPVLPGDPAFTKAGGHTFSMTYSNGPTVVDKVDVCIKCHGPIAGFNFARKDYDGDGVIDGVQTEVQHLLDQVSRLLPNATYRADGNYVADGLVKSPSVKTNWQTRFLQAAWNWQFVNVEGSLGVHNAPYAVGVLKASIADLTDDIDHDGLSDTWEIAKFGSITTYDGFDDPDGDGVSNALEFAAGTNPFLADTDGDGFSDLAELQSGSDPLNNADRPGFVIKIFTAGELEFASEIGKTYRIEMVTALSSTWQSVTTNLPGTGGIISQLVSTRHGGVQAYYRAVQVLP